MTKAKAKHVTINAAELQKGHVIRIAEGVHTRVIEAASSGDLMIIRHVRTGTPRIERGCNFLFRKGERIDVMAELER